MSSQKPRALKTHFFQKQQFQDDVISKTKDMWRDDKVASKALRDLYIIQKRNRSLSAQ